jgi:flagellin
MAIGDISLTAGMRSNLLNLQSTATLLDRTQTRLSTGKKVNTALDDPVNFFKAQSYTNRASDLAALKDGMSDAIQTVKAADAGIKGITTLIASAKSIAASARTADSGSIAGLEAQYNGVLAQLEDLAGDSDYGGVNLLGGNDLTVDFEGGNSLVISSVSIYATGMTGAAISGSAATNLDPTVTGAIDEAINQLDTFLEVLRTTSSTFSSNLAVVTTRQEFTSSMMGVLQTGADNLTLADMNEEGANMLMLQTRQSLGVTALSLSSQAAQSVLRLFG